eukprot:MONOS_2614.1-p1 / transcript=MONOS_2614.1 / gene=MONOS_2614 / organism=Monocercomonoides_exilis_PA203 / gene_product=unspecified product / transcript_product=unspecified product / location=Mono_scaffold00055:30765-41408(+) / protein_length=3547 / sequence_SO=supercontig / SO=protein_coding / is_pseudo=false
MEIGEKTIRICPNENSQKLKRTLITTHKDGSLFLITTGSLQIEFMNISSTIADNSNSISLFELKGSGELTVNNCIVGCANELSVHTIESPIVKIEKGKASIISSIIENFVLAQQASLLTVGSLAHLEMSQVIIRKIRKVEGDGSVLRISIDNDEKFDLDNCTFSECACENGNGGCVHFSTGGRGRLSVGNCSSIANSTQFSGCRASSREGSRGRGGGIYLRLCNASFDYCFKNVGFERNEAKWGNDVFVESTDLKTSITNSSMEFMCRFSEGLEDVIGIDEKWSDVFIPLEYYVLRREEKVAVGNEGYDVSACGFFNYPCKTLEYSILQLEETNREIIFHPQYRIMENMIFGDERGYVLGGVDEKSSVMAVGNTGSTNGVLIVKSNVTIELLRFMLQSSLLYSEMSVVALLEERARISMNECDVCEDETVDTIEYHFLVMRAGKASMKKLSISSLSLISMPFVYACGLTSEIDMSDLSVSDVHMNECSFLKSESAKNVNVSMCNFSSVVLEHGDGSLVNGIIGTNQRMSIDGGLLNGKCKMGNGGGIRVVIEDEGIIRIGNETSVTFEKCYANGEDLSGGLGGGMILKVKGGRDFLLTMVRFVMCNASKYGRDMFVEARSFTEVINNRSIGFSTNITDMSTLMGFENEKQYAIPLVLYLRSEPVSIVVKGENGNDFDKCGYEGYPCLTLDFALEKRKGILGICSEIEGSVEMSHEHIVMEGKVEIKGKALENEINITAEGEKILEVLVQNGASTVVENVKIKVPTQLNGRKGLFRNVEGVLSIISTKIELKSGTSVDYKMLEVIKGSAILSSVIVHGICFLDCQFCKASGEGLITLSSSNISGCSSTISTGLIEVSEKGALSIHGCVITGNSELTSCTAIWMSEGRSISVSNSNFSSWKRKEGNGTVASAIVGEGTSFEWRGVVVSDCTAEAGSGGGMKMKIKEDGMIRIGNEGVSTLFRRCKSMKDRNGEGYGGGVSIECCGKGSKNFVLESLSFENNEARIGINLFGEGHELNKSFLKSSLKIGAFGTNTLSNEFVGLDWKDNVIVPLSLFVNEWSEPGYVGIGGVDYALCGFEWYPCLTIGYAGRTRFEGDNANIRILSGFKIICEVIIDTQEMNIDTSSEMELVKINESIGGGEEGIFVVKESVASLSHILFCAPPRISGVHNSLFICLGGTLNVTKCSIEAESGSLEYQFAKCCSGAMVIESVLMKDIEFLSTEAVIIEGMEAHGVIDSVVFKNVKSEGGIGLVCVNEVASVRCENSTFNSSAFSSHPAIAFAELTTIQLKNNTFEELVRNDGDGGAIVGIVGSEKKAIVKECFFWNITCLDESGKGGSVFVEVKKGGVFECDSNEVKESKVDTESGHGGGIHLTLDSTELTYSMKNIEFGRNEAFEGKDVFVVCPIARVSVNAMWWAGSADEDDLEKKQLWVYETSTGRSMSMLPYLFPADDAIVFVKGNDGENSNDCGIEVRPCFDVKFGVGRMNNNQSIIQIIERGVIGGIVQRNEKSLTIRGGKNENSLMIIEVGGHLELKNGGANAGLTLNRLQILLPCISSFTEVLIVSSGGCSIVNCSFGTGEGTEMIEDIWIVRGSGGLIMMSGIAIECGPFKGIGGVFSGNNCTFVIENTEIMNVHSAGCTLITCEDCKIVEVNGVCVVNCSSELTLFQTRNVQDLSVKNGSCFDGCIAEKGNGGGIKNEMSGSETMKFENCSLKNCKTVAVNEKGGGIYLSFGESFQSNYLLKDVSFGNNSATYGRDVFVFSISLNETIRSTCFVNLSSIEEVSIDLKGEDAEYFIEKPVNLVHFLEQYHSSRVFVSEKGYDMSGCGMVEYPCQTFWRGYSNTEKSMDVHEMVVDGSTYVRDCYDVSRFSIFSFTMEQSLYATLEISTNNIRDKVKGVLMNGDSLDILWIDFLLLQPSSGAVTCLIFSNAYSEGILLDHCIFKIISDIAIEFSIVVVGSGSVIMNECKVQNYSSSVSLFELSAAATMSIERIMIEDVALGDCSVFALSPSTTAKEASKNEMSGIVLNRSIFSKLESDLAKEGIVLRGAAYGDVMLCGCEMKDINSMRSENGGAIYAEIKGQGSVLLKETMIKRCKCNTDSGKGGGALVNSMEALSANKFAFEKVEFEENGASLGVNIFIWDINLNESITTESFKIDGLSSETDGNLFAGSDNSFDYVDLLMFIVEYRGSEVHVSKDGYDALRCGSESEPCGSLMMGLNHIDEGEVKKVVVKDEIGIYETCNLSGFEIGSLVVMSEEKRMGTISFEESKGGDIAILNKKSLRVVGIEFVASETFKNDREALILNENGEIMLRKCSMRSLHTSITPGLFSFLLCDGGELIVEEVDVVNVNADRSIFVVCGARKCEVNNIIVSSVNMWKGSVLDVQRAKESKMEDEEPESISMFKIDNSSFEAIVKNGNGPGVLNCNSSHLLDVVVNKSSVQICSSSLSEKGGMMMMHLDEGGSVKVWCTAILLCGCSTSKGRGGGIFIGTTFEGDLPMMFASIGFESNTAYSGRDLFIECQNISSQINETQFRQVFSSEVYNQINAMYGIDHSNYSDVPVNLLDFIMIYQSDTIFVSSAIDIENDNSRKCGTRMLPCSTIAYGFDHVTRIFESKILIEEESEIEREIILDEITIRSKLKEQAIVRIGLQMQCTCECVINANANVELSYLTFKFSRLFESSHKTFMDINSGVVLISKVQVEGEEEKEKGNVPFHIFSVHGGELNIENFSAKNVQVGSDFFFIEGESSINIVDVSISYISLSFSFIQSDAISSNIVLKEITVECVTLEHGSLISLARTSGLNFENSKYEKTLKLTLCSFQNISKSTVGASILILDGKNYNVFDSINCSISECFSISKFGSIFDLRFIHQATVDSCHFEGKLKNENLPANDAQEICVWNGSLISIENSNATMRETTVANSSEGGVGISGGKVEIEKGEFVGNDPSIARFPSIRRNILCEHNGKLEIDSLKGGDGLLPNTSLWILNEGCELTGIPTERLSEFFIPSLDAVEVKENGDAAELTFKGRLLIPCNLSFQIVSKIDDVSSIETFPFSEDCFDSENEAKGKISMSLISSAAREEEVFVCILFGKGKTFSSTDSLILKNKSESQTSGDERIAEGEKEGKSSWALIVIIMAIVLLIVLIVSVILAVRWRKAKNEAEDLREIVNANIRKDPKAFEMVTMEMSPEAQWKRAEREAEKKNDERIKKREYAKSLQHSESSEHLLAESGSTEYILGKDSDKIPEWILEKVDEEETRKRTPSPSISSTSSTDTSDTESTFVRREDLCPTTSSMSNLVDAMACSSPHEKLIVDLRDSLFMLLHGKNEKKEMAIGTLEEREMTAAQILFWVANLALHSFDEMENKLQSLSNLSPHIVLFSEHMVICIVMHSDLLSDDSDSSSISSSTVITSASDDDDDESDSLPSSAFDDEDSFKKECLRWKAPELLINKNMGATKESVAFSIGMMLWECLTLHIPFGEYEAVIAGDKIAKGEALSMCGNAASTFSLVVSECLSFQPSNRPSLVSISREFFQKFPESAKLPTMTDALFTNQQSAISRNSCCSY